MKNVKLGRSIYLILTKNKYFFFISLTISSHHFINHHLISSTNHQPSKSKSLISLTLAFISSIFPFSQEILSKNDKMIDCDFEISDKEFEYYFFI